MINGINQSKKERKQRKKEKRDKVMQRKNKYVKKRNKIRAGQENLNSKFFIPLRSNSRQTQVYIEN